MNKLTTILLVLLTAACAPVPQEEDWAPLPYHVYPKPDQQRSVVRDIQESVADWNEKLRPSLGYDVFIFHEEGEPDPSACGTIVVGFGGILNNKRCHEINGEDCQATADLRDKCHLSVNLNENGFWNTTIRHELGHTLGLPDISPEHATEDGPNSIMVQGTLDHEILPSDVHNVVERINHRGGPRPPEEEGHSSCVVVTEE